MEADPAVSPEEAANSSGGIVDPELTPLRKGFYASAMLGLGSLEFVVAVFLLKYYTDFTGLEAMWAGVALLLGKAFDAVSDPIMGYASDRTRTRWGRRRPWFLLGSIPLALSFAGMFSASPEWSQMRLFTWLVATNVLFFCGTTMIDVPHSAYASEMTSTHRERISLMGWRQGFMMLGLLLGGLVTFTFLERTVAATTAEALASGLSAAEVADVARLARGGAHGTITGWLGLYVLAVGVITFLGTRERRGPFPPPRDTRFGDFHDTLRSGPFRLLALVAVIGQVADGLTASLALYAIEQWWGLAGPHPKLLLIGYMAMAAISIPLWMRIAVHFEKANMLAAGTVTASAGLVGMLFVPELGIGWAYAMFYLAGAALGCRTVLTMAIVPDIIDDDELRTRTRKDGSYFGTLSLLRKLSRSLAIGLSGIGLGLFGYVSGAAHQGPEAIRGIVIMFCGVPIAFSAVAAALLLFFPLTRARQDRTLAEILRRRAIEPTDREAR